VEAIRTSSSNWTVAVIVLQREVDHRNEQKQTIPLIEHIHRNGRPTLRSCLIDFVRHHEYDICCKYYESGGRKETDIKSFPASDPIYICRQDEKKLLRTHPLGDKGDATLCSPSSLRELGERHPRITSPGGRKPGCLGADGATLS
jgi:hypothetical protein